MGPINRHKTRRRFTEERGVYIFPENAPGKKLFVCRPLPKLELFVYAFIIACTIAYMWFKVYEVSSTYPWRRCAYNFQWKKSWLLGKRLKDVSDRGWREWHSLACRVLPFYLLHFVLFNFGSKFLPHAAWSMTVFIFWTCALCHIYGSSVVFVTAVFGVALYTVAKLSRNPTFIWSLTFGFLYGIIEHSQTLFDRTDSTECASETLFCAYAAVHFISCCMDSINSKLFDNGHFAEGLYAMFWYSFYLPYHVVLIVPFKDFTQQLNQRKQLNTRGLWSTILFGLRILVWYFFHLRFVVTCGMHAFFARLDAMQPMALPICVSRVILYSKIWRSFDRGLYLFFKQYVIYPICAPTFSVPRRLLAMLVCFSFVHVWHGLSLSTFVWISMNIVEILLENVCKAVYTVSSVRRWREDHLSDGMFRRMLALAYVVPYYLSLYSNFYFLSSSQAGFIYVKKIFYEDTLKMKFPFLLLTFLGYCYGNLVMEVDDYLERKNNQAKGPERDDSQQPLKTMK
ncbi:unnamed protein product [Soboliphyme baturini]|uniref:Protein-cysteine N-palmitoyltransferase HHAT n=1 Tax=Soboliphyme baturini TaxID=241478 RepID=A0A183J6M8_9BILA|nr:unnamed protein product [Soboliphyme baturini]